MIASGTARGRRARRRTLDRTVTNGRAQTAGRSYGTAEVAMRRPMLVALVALLEVACGRLGQYTSLAIGGDGRGLVSYQDGPDGTLRVAHCEDGPCTRATVNTLDRPFDRGGVQISVGPNTSLAIGRDGLGLVSYLDDFGGEGATDADRNRLLLDTLADVPREKRGARFTSAVAVARGDEVLFRAQESVEGAIAEEPRGANGFGYDPLFFYPPLGRTFGESRPEDKDRVSHRGKAFARLRRFLESLPAHAGTEAR